MALLTEAERVGFFCHKPVHHRALYWSGTEMIYLHPACAFHLAVGLLGDVKEYTQQYPREAHAYRTIASGWADGDGTDDILGR